MPWDHLWVGFLKTIEAVGPGLFLPNVPAFAARAPGRLDVLGGVADYSGSTVLERTIAEATFAAVQQRSDGRIVIRTMIGSGSNFDDMVELSIEQVDHVYSSSSPQDFGAVFRDNPRSSWAAYPAGCAFGLIECGWLDPLQLRGFNVLIDSQVQLGAGVSSSAALEVAVMSALCACYGVKLDGLDLAKLCQWVENNVVGAPCGIMDQVTCALGQAESMLVLKCQPHQVIGHIQVPVGWELIGLDSGVKHSVAGDPYARARVGAFMGLRILQAHTSEDLGGYLCNASPSSWMDRRQSVPESMTGSQFLREFGGISDTVARIEPDVTYKVRANAEHPILENDRVREFTALMGLATSDRDEQLLVEAGQLMLDAHRSYSERIDLGSAETDLLVELAMDRGPSGGVFGAKITGGGSGGTVAVLLSGPNARESIEWVVREYERRTGIRARLMAGSSPGAMQMGIRQVR